MVYKARFHASQSWEGKNKNVDTSQQRTLHARNTHAHQLRKLKGSITATKGKTTVQLQLSGRMEMLQRKNIVLLRGLSDAHSCFRVQVGIPHGFIHLQGRSRTQVTLGSKEEGKEGQNQPAKRNHNKTRLTIGYVQCCPMAAFPHSHPIFQRA